MLPTPRDVRKPVLFRPRPCFLVEERSLCQSRLRITVTETFFSISILDMQRATAFYVDSLGAAVVFASPGWSSLRIAACGSGSPSIPSTHRAGSGCISR
jgi:hypothetical protein